MASNMFIKIDGIDGECEDTKHSKWIEILSWSHGFSQPASPVRDSTGSTIERANHSDFNITKYVDSATYGILKACWNGKQIKNVNVECMRADGDNEALGYLKINMEDVIVSNFSVSGGGGSIPVENISLSYGKVQYVYNPKKKDDGTPGGEQKASHDLKSNTVE